MGDLFRLDKSNALRLSMYLVMNLFDESNGAMARARFDSEDLGGFNEHWGAAQGIEN